MWGYPVYGYGNCGGNCCNNNQGSWIWIILVIFIIIFLVGPGYGAGPRRI